MWWLLLLLVPVIVGLLIYWDRHEVVDTTVYVDMQGSGTGRVTASEDE